MITSKTIVDGYIEEIKSRGAGRLTGLGATDWTRSMRLGGSGDGICHTWTQNQPAMDERIKAAHPTLFAYTHASTQLMSTLDIVVQHTDCVSSSLAIHAMRFLRFSRTSRRLVHPFLSPSFSPPAPTSFLRPFRHPLSQHASRLRLNVMHLSRANRSSLMLSPQLPFLPLCLPPHPSIFLHILNQTSVQLHHDLNYNIDVDRSPFVQKQASSQQRSIHLQDVPPVRSLLSSFLPDLVRSCYWHG